jgi:hypothetical protein
MRHAQNRTHISCSAAAWGVRGWGYVYTATVAAMEARSFACLYVYIERNKKVKKLYAHHTSYKYLKTEDHHVLVSSNDVCKVLVGANL